MHTEPTTSGNARNLRIAIVVSRYHRPVTDALRAGAVARFLSADGAEDDLLIVEAPGAFELVAIARSLAGREDIDAVVALGCVITGETPHDQYICSAVATGLASIAVLTGVPVAFGVLTCRTLEQAHERAGGAHGNKGDEAMAAAIDAALTIRAIDAAKERVN